MKNKQGEQRKAREQHRQQIRADRARKQGESLINLSPRKGETRGTNPIILIACGTTNTERTYFEQFRLTSARIKVKANAVDPMTLVNYADRLQKQADYEQVSCVFDKDDTPDSAFDEAIKKASELGIQVAYSNQSFEYWLILHFDDHSGDKLKRGDYDARLNSYLKLFKVYYNGKGSKVISPNFFDVLQAHNPKAGKSYQQIAIERANKIHEKCKHVKPSATESCTTVYKLVEELNQYKATKR